MALFLFLVYYTYLWIEEVKKARESNHVLVVKDKSGQIVPFAIIRIKEANGAVVFTRVADALGRVFILAPKGSYTLEIVKAPHNSRRVEVHSQTIDLPTGILTHPLTIKF